MNFSFRAVFFRFAVVFALVAFLILAKSILIPLSFAFLLAFIVLPLARKLENWQLGRAGGAFLALLALLLVIAGVFALLSGKILQFSGQWSEFKESLLALFAELSAYANRQLGFLPELDQGELLEQLKGGLGDSAARLLSQTFSGTANVLFGLFTALIFSFLILLYRRGLVRALLQFYPQEQRQSARNLFARLQKIGQHYLVGMLGIIAILGLVNSLGLWLIGLEQAFFFGFFAAILAVIPYAGTFIGAAIPVLYALVTYDSLWMPLSIALFFWAVQVVESNILTPKIVGGNLRLNAFASILCIIVGGSIWGVAGMIIFLPLTAMFKSFCEEYDNLKPLALLLSEENYQDEQPSAGPLSKIKAKGSNLLSRWFKR